MEKSVKKPIRILSVGNSFSMDQQTYVHQMAKAAGLDITVVNAYIGGCTFKRHLNELGQANYQYQLNGCEVVQDGWSLDRFIELGNWDFITFQPGTSGLNRILPEEPYLLTQVLEYIKYKNNDPKTVYALNLSWGDCDTSTRMLFNEYFGRSRKAMLAEFEKFAKISVENGIEYIIPGGYAVDIGFEKYGLRMYRDGFHASELARYMHACLWFKFFTGLPAPENYEPKKPSYNGGVLPTAEERADMRSAASEALRRVKEWAKCPEIYK